MRRVRPAFILIAAMAFGFVWSLPASAQTQPPAAQSMPDQAFSNEELKSFAVASLDVQRINDDAQTKLQGAADPDQQMKIAVDAEEKMTKAVEEKGLSIAKYNSIVQAARTDENLARQIIDLRRQAQ